MKKSSFALFFVLLTWSAAFAQDSETAPTNFRELKKELRSAQQKMAEELRSMGMPKMSGLIDSAFYYFDFDHLGEDDHIAAPELDERSLGELFDEMQSQLSQIEGIDTNAMNDLMEFFWNKMRESGPSDEPQNGSSLGEEPAKRKRRVSSL